MHKLLIINPGPKINPTGDFGPRLKSLSSSFSGKLITSGYKDIHADIGKFNLHCYKLSGKKSITRNLSYLYIVISFLIKEKLSKNKYDLIITYDPIKTGLIGVLAKYLFDAKFAPEINGDYGDIINYADTKNILIRKLKHRLYCFIISNVFRFADGIKLLHPNQTDGLLSDKKKERINILHIPSYIDISRFENIADTKEILFVGYPMYRKGLDILTTAFKKVAKKNPEWKLKILGWYPEEELLKSLINDCVQIYHHPAVTTKEMPEHIGKCGFFVLPSRSEAMGRVLVEAMASGKARIGSAVGGIPTVINDGIDGLLFESENSDELADKLHLLMNDDEYRKSLGKNGLQRAKSEFSIESINKRFVRFYLSICSK